MASKKLVFISEAKQKDSKTTISARIDKALFDDFQLARQKAQAQGFELRITDICEKAIKMAVDEVNKMDVKE